MAASAAITPLIIVLALLAAAEHPEAQKSPPPEPAASGPAATGGKNCLTNLMNMSDCLSYVQAGSNETTPDKACCPELAGLVESSPVCLCYLSGGVTAVQFGIKLDTEKALKLPSVCGVSTPPSDLCSALGIPGAVPSASPDAQPPEGLDSNSKTGKNGNGASRTANSAKASLCGFLIIAVLI